VAAGRTIGAAVAAAVGVAASASATSATGRASDRTTAGTSFSGSIPGNPRTATMALSANSTVTEAATRDMPAPMLAMKARVVRISPPFGTSGRSL
jgi:hypothetical protein